MTLQETATAALALTRELQEALTADDLGLCEALLLRRAEAMVAFEDRHRAAGDPELAAARGLILELRAHDRRLQDLAAEVFALAEQAFRSQLGAQPVSAYGSLTCLDRRA